MADNTQLSAAIGVGDVAKSLEDTDGNKWFPGVAAWVTSLDDPDVFQFVDATHGLPVHQQTGATWAMSLATLPALTAGSAAIGKLAANSGVDIGDVDVTTLPAITIAAAQTLATVTTVGAVTAITNALPAGANAIGKLAANSGVDIGDVDVTSVPADPFGVNADAASATGSISAKLRFIAATGIPITGTVTVGSHAVTNAGTFAVQVDGNALTSLQLIDDAVFVDDAAFTPGTSKGFAVGFQADETATDSVDEGDFGVPRITLDRKVIVTPQPHTAGGLSVFRSLDMDESEEEVKGTPGCLYKLRMTNRTTSARYVKLYNDTAANVIVGTTVPIDTIVVPGGASADLCTVVTESFGAFGLTFSAALCIAATTGLADNDTGAPGVNDVVVTAYYK